MGIQNAPHLSRDLTGEFFIPSGSPTIPAIKAHMPTIKFEPCSNLVVIAALTLEGVETPGVSNPTWNFFQDEVF
jgi:hypothetical protein